MMSTFQKERLWLYAKSIIGYIGDNDETSTEPSPIVIEDKDKEVLHEQEGEI